MEITILREGAKIHGVLTRSDDAMQTIKNTWANVPHKLRRFTNGQVIVEFEGSDTIVYQLDTYHVTHDRADHL